MSRDLSHFIAFVRSTPWAILPERGRVMLDVLERRAHGIRLTPDEIALAIDAKRGDSMAARVEATSMRGTGGGAVALIPLSGTLVHRQAEVVNASGGGLVSTEALAKALRAADANPDVSAIVLDVDSPGGSVFGVEELANVIESLTKPLVAVANATAASGAYWLASLADEFVVTPSGEVGSIGVVAVHQDVSAALAAEGVKLTFITAGKNKVENNSAEPMTEEGRAHMQSRVDAYYTTFVKSVARGRGVSTKKVESDFGQGRMFGAKEALALGMVDRVATLDEAVSRAMNGKVKKGAARASRGDDVTVYVNGEFPDVAAVAAGVRAEMARVIEAGRMDVDEIRALEAEGTSARETGSDAVDVDDLDLREREAWSPATR